MTGLVAFHDQDVVRLLFHLFQSSLLLSSPFLPLLLLSVFIFNFHSQITDSHLLLSFTINQAQFRDRNSQSAENINAVSTLSIDSLPSEVFSHAISFLQPRDVANASAVSSKWRKVINSIAELHDEIDLLNVSERTKSNQKMTYHFNHLSARCNHKPVKVSLDLTGFFVNKPFYEKPKKVFPVFLFDLHSALVDSSQSLREIKLVVKGIEGQDPRKVCLIPFVSEFIKKLLEDCSKLQKVWIEIPNDYNFKAGEGLKQVSLTSKNSEGRYHKCMDSEFDLSLLTAVKGFTQSGFTEFDCVQADLNEHSSTRPSTGLTAEQLWATLSFHNAFLEGLSDSTSSLRILNLSLVHHTSEKELWDFAMKCENLSSLTLRFYRGEDIIQFEVPKRMNRKSQLKKLDLQFFERHQVDWEALSNWVGDGLEDLRISVHGNSGLLFSTNSPLFNSRKTLKKLDLSESAPSEEDLPTSQLSRFFPKLEGLILDRVNVQTREFFSTLISPNIRSIEVLENRQVVNSEYLLSALKLFRNHSRNLLMIVLEYEDGKDLQVGKEFSNLIFPKLQSLYLLSDEDSIDENVVEIFSTFVYPSLSYLELSNEDLKVKFQKDSPKLKLE